MNPEIYEKMAEVERKHWWFEGRKAIICERIDALHLSAEARILDVGCGTGALTEALTDFGSVVACDPSEFALRRIRETARLKPLHPRQLLSDSEWVERFDLICFFDVIEHVEDDVALVKEYSPLLKNGGVIAISVPAWSFLRGHHDRVSGHFRRYRRSTLLPVFEAAGLAITSVSYFNLFLAPCILASRIVERMLSSHRGYGDLELPPTAINAVLTRVFRAERYLLRRFDLPFGVSLLATGRKPVTD